MKIAIRYSAWLGVHILLTGDDGKETSFGTGVKILKNEWDEERRRVKETHPDHLQLNRIILDKYRQIEKAATDNVAESDTGVVRWMQKVAAKSATNHLTLNSFYAQYIETNFDPRSNQFRNQNKFLKTLARFNPDIAWPTLTKLLVFDFDNWMHKQLFSDTTCIVYHTYLKGIIRKAYRKGYIEDDPYEGVSFGYKNESSRTIYLEDYEIMLIHQCVVNGKKKNIAKDYFVISCYTALDWSTIKTLNRNSFYKKGTHRYIRIQRIKTKTNVIIPVHPIVDEIMSKYDYSLPVLDIDQDWYNILIKQIAKEAGITSLVSITDKNEEKLVEKWELVSSHTGRRSAATNMYLAGIRPLQIRIITGHKTEESFLKYIRISKQYNADLVAESKYFQVNPAEKS